MKISTPSTPAPPTARKEDYKAVVNKHVLERKEAINREKRKKKTYVGCGDTMETDHSSVGGDSRRVGFGVEGYRDEWCHTESLPRLSVLACRFLALYTRRCTRSNRHHACCTQHHRHQCDDHKQHTCGRAGGAHTHDDVYVVPLT